MTNQAHHFEITMGDPEWTDKQPIGDGWAEGTRAFSVTLRHQRRQFTLDFFQGPAHEKEPDIDDVLDCVILDSQGIDNARSFEDWASDFGYDTDSRKAEAIFKTCKRQRAELKRLMGNDYDSLLEHWRLL